METERPGFGTFVHPNRMYVGPNVTNYHIRGLNIRCIPGKPSALPTLKPKP